MDIRKFDRFADIPGSNLLTDKIPIFATQEYADYLRDVKSRRTIWLTCIENSSVAYLLSLVIYKKILFKKGYCLTGVISLSPGNSPAKEREFLNEIISYVKKNKLCDWIQQSCNWALFNAFPSGSKAVKFGTYKIFLKDKTEDELFSSVKRNTRQDIKRALKEKVQIKKGENYLNDCLLIINNTAKKADLDLLTELELKKMILYFKGKLRISVSYFEDIPQSALISISNEYCTYALYAGSVNKAFRGANVYLDWEAILEAKNSNSNCFDFVGARINPPPGSKLERIQNHKKSFGCEFVQGYLWKMVISERKFRFYQISVKFSNLIRNKKMKKDIIDQEFEIQKNEDIYTDG